MSRRNYTHIKELLPTIQAMVAEEMTQREIAEHFLYRGVFCHIRFTCTLYKKRL